ncbi:unnamed protein product [Notodromas monacha]|uniref:Uncharacterized protein n=1 Tax=Notodromas monacha TaxID=399045 RepID=A0A7R9BES7_9CRUS|nr:unnamed protein product [Notodromas monacha]CAG0914052.1 unnamed protein product [Notodromas monacha]
MEHLEKQVSHVIMELRTNYEDLCFVGNLVREDMLEAAIEFLTKASDELVRVKTGLTEDRVCGERSFSPFPLEDSMMASSIFERNATVLQSGQLPTEIFGDSRNERGVVECLEVPTPETNDESSGDSEDLCDGLAFDDEPMEESSFEEISERARMDETMLLDHIPTSSRRSEDLTKTPSRFAKSLTSSSVSLTPSTTTRKCEGKTKSGVFCQRSAKKGRSFCFQHDDGIKQTIKMRCDHNLAYSPITVSLMARVGKQCGFFTDLNAVATGQCSHQRLAQDCRDDRHLVQRLSLLKSVRRHSGCVNTISWSDDGEYLLSGSDDRNVVVLKAYDYQVREVIAVPCSSNIFCARFMPDTGNMKIVSCAGSGVICLSDIGVICRPELSHFLCHSETAYEVLPLDSNCFFSCSEDKTVRFFDVRVNNSCHDRGDAECNKSVLLRCSRPASTIALEPTTRDYLAVGTGDSAVRIYDRRRLSPLSAAEGVVAKFTARGGRAATRRRESRVTSLTETQVRKRDTTSTSVSPSTSVSVMAISCSRVRF